MINQRSNVHYLCPDAKLLGTWTEAKKCNIIKESEWSVLAAWDPDRHSVAHQRISAESDAGCQCGLGRPGVTATRRDGEPMHWHASLAQRVKAFIQTD